MEKGVPIRAISRGLAVLTTVNRDGPISMMEISRSASVPYPTACRIVQTLLHEGYIEQEPARKRYRATSLVQTLSTGFQPEDLLVSAARSHIEALCEEVGWPISLATRVGTRMMVRDSTHEQTTLTFSNYYPGYTMPIAECASGKVHLAFCTGSERGAIIDGWKSVDDESARMGLLLMGDNYLLNKIRKDGYAQQIRNVYTAEPGKTSSLAVPVFGREDRFVGSMALIYFDSAMSRDNAVEQYLPVMQQTARAIAADLSDPKVTEEL